MRPAVAAVKAPQPRPIQPITERELIRSGCRATLVMVYDAPRRRPPRPAGDPVVAVEQGILLEVPAMLKRLTRRLDAQVARLVAARLAPIDRAEARRFMADFRSGEIQ